jgi:hypothetical protein
LVSFQLIAFTVKRIRGAYKVVAFNEQELQEKTQRKGTLADEAIRIANGILSRSSSSPFPKPTGKKEDVKAKDAKKGVGITFMQSPIWCHH